MGSSQGQLARSQCMVSSHDFVLVVIASLSTVMQQVLISAAVGAASTQKSAIDLWWNTTFLSPDGENRKAFIGTGGTFHEVVICSGVSVSPVTGKYHENYATQGSVAVMCGMHFKFQVSAILARCQQARKGPLEYRRC